MSKRQVLWASILLGSAGFYFLAGLWSRQGVGLVLGVVFGIAFLRYVVKIRLADPA